MKSMVGAAVWDESHSSTIIKKLKTGRKRELTRNSPYLICSDASFTLTSSSKVAHELLIVSCFSSVTILANTNKVFGHFERVFASSAESGPHSQGRGKGNPWSLRGEFGGCNSEERCRDVLAFLKGGYVGADAVNENE